MRDTFAKDGYFLNFFKVHGDEAGVAWVYTLIRHGVECLCKTLTQSPCEKVFDEMIDEYEKMLIKEFKEDE